MDTWSFGLDAGSTAVKAVILSPEGECLWKRYLRHEGKVEAAAKRLVGEGRAAFPGRPFRAALTGMGGLVLAPAWHVPFVQELTAEAAALSRFDGAVDASIELGGEDAKVTYFREGRAPDQRMNRDCAGGTGAFLDHLAALLGTDAAGLNGLAAEGRRIYPIAARCGVFARTDVQGLLNEGADRRDIALSVFQAIVNQVLSGLARGTPIRGKVAFLGGPLTFMPVLRRRFMETLRLQEEDAVVPALGVFYGALGAALSAGEREETLQAMAARIAKAPPVPSQAEHLAPLFASAKEYDDFRKAHARAKVRRGDLASHKGPLWLGVDAGSTTMKAVLTDEGGAVLFTWYQRHGGDVLGAAKRLLADMYRALPEGACLAAAGVTGYGESLLKKAFHFDLGEVETVAHVRGARSFCPDMTALLDIGGQDMKYCRLEGGVLSRIALNSACSSGCGAFLENFAGSFHMTAEEFARAAVQAKGALDLGARCTVLMNSRVKEIQRAHMDLGELAAGLSLSVVKNALYKVIRLADAKEMGDRVVVEGGTFYNDAVLRAFEMLLGRPVIRPDLAGLMGAYGMALLAQEEKGKSASSLLPAKEAAALTVSSKALRCQGCGNHCQVMVKTFSDGSLFVTGNRCERGEWLAAGKRPSEEAVPDGYGWIRDHVFRTMPVKGPVRGTVGIPAVLDMWEDFPYWAAFFAALGYRVIRSDFSEEGASATAETIPEGVFCHACMLAHVHLWDLLQKKPSFIWMPCRPRGEEEPEIDERRHAAYGDRLGKAMKEAIDAAGVPFLHPHLPKAGDKAMIDALAKAFTQWSRDSLENAVKAAEAAQISYYEGLKAETARALKWAGEKHRQAVILCGRPYQADPQIHKGIPHMTTSCGAAVLSGEGLMLLGGGKPLLDTPEAALRDILLGALPFAEKNEALQYVQLHSISCGYDGLTRQEVEEALARAGKLYTVISLDQGLNGGAIAIRLRSLLAEARSLSLHPEAREKLKRSVPVTSGKGKAFLLPSLSPWYDRLLAAAFQGEGQDVTLLPETPGYIAAAAPDGSEDVPALEGVTEGENEEKRVLVLSSPQDAARWRQALALAGRRGGAVYFDITGQGVIPVTISFLHRYFGALFLGDFFLRAKEGLAFRETGRGETEAVLKGLMDEAEQVVRGGSFAAYEGLLRKGADALRSVALTEEERPAVGIDGDPFLRLRREVSPEGLIEKAGGRAVEVGLGEWETFRLTEMYWGKSFGGDRKGMERCMAARNTAMVYRNALTEAVRAVPALDPLSEGWGRRIFRRIRYHEGDGLPEEKRELLLRGADAVIAVTSCDDGGNAALFHQARPDLPLLTMPYMAGQSRGNLENRIRLLVDEAGKR